MGLKMTKDELGPAGGLLDNVDVEITDAWVSTIQYTGRPDLPHEVAVFLEFTPDDGSDPKVEHYTAGSVSKKGNPWLTPSADDENPVEGDIESLAWNQKELTDEERESIKGYFIIPQNEDSGAQISGGSGIVVFNTYLVKAGCPEDWFERSSDFRELYIGVRGHLNRIKNIGPGAKDKEDKFGYPVLTSFEAPKSKKGGKAAAGKTDGKKTSGAGAGATSKKSSDADFEEELKAAIVTFLGENDGSATKREVAGGVPKQFKANSAQYSRAMVLCNKAEWLGDGENPWLFDAKSGELSLG